MRGLLVGIVALAACRYGFGEQARSDGGGDAVDADRPIDAKPDTGYCARIPALAAPPAIDGVLDPGLVLETLQPVGWASSVMPLPPVPDVPVHFVIAYRPDGLYFFLDVLDPDLFPARMQDPTYCGDGVELYVDHDGVLTDVPNFDAAALQFIARVPVDVMTPRSEGEYFHQTELLGAWQTGYVITPRAGGYTFEGFVDAATMQLGSWTLARGQHVGIDLGLNLSSSDGSAVPINECPQSTRLGQLFLRIDESMAAAYGGGAPFWTPTAFCLALLD